MSFNPQDGVVDSSITTGTSDYVCAGVPTPWSGSAFAIDASLSDGDTCQYTALGVDPATGARNGTGLEHGLGTWNHSTLTLERTLIYRSTNSNAKVSWAAGTRYITITRLAEGTLLVRQPGGTVGTDQVEISHDGTHCTIESKDGGFTFVTPYASGINLGAGNAVQVEVYQLILSILYGNPIFTAWQLASRGMTLSRGNAMVGFCDAATYNVRDIAITSPEAKVLSLVTDDSFTAGGRFQNTGARSRLTSAVTNVTTTLANYTDLSQSVINGRKYGGFLALPLNDATAADGFKLDFNGGSATFSDVRFGFPIGTPNTGTRNGAALSDVITLTALPDTNDCWVIIPIECVASSSGTIIPRQAKNSDAAGATLTTRASAYFWLEDTP